MHGSILPVTTPPPRWTPRVFTIFLPPANLPPPPGPRQSPRCPPPLQGGRKKKASRSKNHRPPPPQKLNGRPLTLVKLPAYSYDLNSIEMVFAQEKAIARFSPGALSQDLMLAIVSAFEQVQPLNEGPGAFLFKSVLSQN